MTTAIRFPLIMVSTPEVNIGLHEIPHKAQRESAANFWVTG
jgi:hypothetical protein